MKKFTKEDCIKAIQLASKEHDNLISVSLYKKWRNKNPNQPSIMTITVNLGSFTKAKEIAEIDILSTKLHKKKMPSEQECIKSIQLSFQELGGNFTGTHYNNWAKKTNNPITLSTLNYIFGSWGNALQKSNIKKLKEELKLKQKMKLLQKISDNPKSSSSAVRIAKKHLDSF